MTDSTLSYRSVRDALALAEHLATAGLDVFFGTAPVGESTAAEFATALEAATGDTSNEAASVITALALVLDFLASESGRPREVLETAFALHRSALDRILEADVGCDDIPLVRRRFLDLRDED